MTPDLTPAELESLERKLSELEADEWRAMHDPDRGCWVVRSIRWLVTIVHASPNVTINHKKYLTFIAESHNHAPALLAMAKKYLEAKETK